MAIPNTTQPSLKDLPHNMKPSVETLLALVQAGRITEAKILVEQCQLNYQHPILIEAGVIKGIEVTENWLKKLITNNQHMIELKRHVRILAPTQETVLIQGESGTGKELIAHALAGNRTGNFVALNCAGMPEHLIESELFGHVAGAFTDAKQSKMGLMQQAQNGTLFLDEIGDLDIKVQAKFLRAIQERVIRPVGSNKEYEINCRIVCATHWNLENLVTLHRFRLDLYARISTFILQTTPLKERLEDVLPIITMLCNGDTKVINAFTPIIKTMPMPYNVRSLEAYVKRYILLETLPCEITK